MGPKTRPYEPPPYSPETPHLVGKCILIRESQNSIIPWGSFKNFQCKVPFPEAQVYSIGGAAWSQDFKNLPRRKRYAAKSGNHSRIQLPALQAGKLRLALQARKLRPRAGEDLAQVFAFLASIRWAQFPQHFIPRPPPQGNDRFLSLIRAPSPRPRPRPSPHALGALIGMLILWVLSQVPAS